MAECTLAQALELIREELGLTDCPKPRQVVQRACETLGLGLEATKPLRQQVHEICEFCDIATGWSPTDAAPAVPQPDPRTTAHGQPSLAQAEEGVPPKQPAPATVETRRPSVFLLMVVPCKPLVSVGTKLRLTATDLPGLLVGAAQKLALDVELEMSLFGDEADADPLVVTSLDQVPPKAKVQFWPKGLCPAPAPATTGATMAMAPESKQRLSRESGMVVSQSIIDEIDQAIEQAEALQPYSCRVTGAETVRGSSGAFGGQHTEYQIELLWGPRDGPYQLIRTSKRYSDFHRLDKVLRPLLGPNTIPKLPKKAVNKNAEAVVRQRMELLKQYLDSATRQVAQLEAYMLKSAAAKKLIDEFLNATVLDVGPEPGDAAMVADTLPHSATGGAR